MSIKRDDPYGNFNFLVDLGTGDTSTVVAGFQDVTGLGIEVTTAEYRNGNEPVNHVRKVNGMYKIGDVHVGRPRPYRGARPLPVDRRHGGE